MAVPLEQLSVTVYDDVTDLEHEVLALDPSRMEDVKFVLYQPPPVGEALSDDATVGEYKERLTFISQDLHWLLSLPHDKFWCQAIFDETVLSCVDSYLRYAPRSHDVVVGLPGDIQRLHDDIHRSVFFVCVRLATHKESKVHFITPEEFGKIIYENYIFDIPKLMDLSVLYGAGNGQLLGKMINNIFAQQPQYLNDLKGTIPTVVEVFQKIANQCGVRLDPLASSPVKLQATDSAGKSPLDAMVTGKLQDIVFYLLDTANTLLSFLEVYPDAAKVFSEDDFPSTISALSESLFPVLWEAVKDHAWPSDDLQGLIKQKVASTQLCLLKVFRQIVEHSSLLPLLSDCAPEEAEQLMEKYLQLISSSLGDRRFIANLEYLNPFRDDRDILSQAQCPIDETRLQFIQDAVNESYATFAKPKTSNGAFRLPQDINGDRDERSDQGHRSDDVGAAGADYQEADHDDALGACAPHITGVELESLISSVKDLLPDLGEGFIEICLEEMNYDVEKVINMVLEDKLPVSLQDYSKTMPRQAKVAPAAKTTTEPSALLTERHNIYDFDEFDVFSRDDVDVSRVHKGKKDKIGTDVNKVLDDKSAVDRLRPLYDRYGSEFVESMYDQTGGEYDDEYDDTYDSNLVGMTDADSADELTMRRPFTVPRVLGGGNLNAQEESSEDDQESGRGPSTSAGREPAPPRDQFLEDPAKIRQRQEERRAQKEAMRRKPAQQRSRGQGQRGRQDQGQQDAKGQGHQPEQGQGHDSGEKRYDVTGKPKGQGQDASVLKNRAWKEKNKATRVHHNRKQLSDKKRKF